MGTLFIDRKHSHVSMQGDVLALRVAGSNVQHVPVKLLSRVVIRSTVELSSAVLSGLSSRGIGLVVLAGRRGDQVAHVIGAPHKDARLRVTQIRRLDDESFNLAWCRRVLRLKLRSQIRMLAVARAERPDLRKPLHDGLSTLFHCSSQLTDSLSIDSMRGLEGAAAAAYFMAWGRLFAPSLGFHGRRRRPPTDPINASLSLGYTLLYSLAVQACHEQGLDPMIGYLHRPAHGRCSLACDVMEPWRAQVDHMVWQLFRKQVLRKEHFGHEGSGACLLIKTGRGPFFYAWAAKARLLQRALRRQARLVTRSMGDLTQDLFEEASFEVP